MSSKLPNEIEDSVFNYLPPHERHTLRLYDKIQAYRAKNPLQESLLGPDEKFRDDIKKNSNWKIIDKIISSALADNVIMRIDNARNNKKETINAIKSYFSLLINDLLPMKREWP